MTWTLVQKNSANNDASGTSLQVTLGAAVTSGNLVFITISWADTSTATIDDTIGNTYAILDPQSDSGQSAGAAGTVNVTNIPQTFTLHNNPATTFRDITVEEWSCTGGPSPGIDQHTGAINSAIADGAGFNTGNVVTTVDGDLILSSANCTTTSFPAQAGSGFTRNSTIGGEATESQAQSAQGTIAGTWVNPAGGGIQGYITNVIAFKPAAAAGGSAKISPRLMIPRLGPQRGFRALQAFPSGTIVSGTWSSTGAANDAIWTGQSVGPPLGQPLAQRILRPNIGPARGLQQVKGFPPPS